MSLPPLQPDTAIQVVGLGKKYRIGGILDWNKTMRDSLSLAARSKMRALRAWQRGETHSRRADNTFWALRDVSFEVERGEVLGVIGRNGAGKSTLLKVLTRIMPPDEGHARIRGRIGSLLEVGTGFHGELTGRENIYLNGAVLGMHRFEIDRKYDEIVDFAGVARFIDTPVKHYSSGMYLRLAFSVAAHLEPEILLVDEVLAVGDAEFQKKCLGKMGDVAGEGRTVLFVSHNMDAVRQLCQSALWLERGNIRALGPVSDMIKAYLAETALDRSTAIFPVMDVHHGIGIEDLRLALTTNPTSGALDLRVELDVRAEAALPRIGIGFGLMTDTGMRVTYLDERLTDFVFDMQPGTNHFLLECNALDRLLAAGDYVISVWLAIADSRKLIEIDRAASIRLPGVDFYGSGHYVDVHKHGPLLFPLQIRRVEPAHPAG
ncbi:MAG: polysaccharide ABC transporter ATP-binding protein [Anaerolineae bacterium]|nr:polysaccharide ABC transporter ATP-binding protein [Anaerolineae bacterium]